MYRNTSDPKCQIEIAKMAHETHVSTDPIELLRLSMKRLEMEQQRRKTTEIVVGISASLALGYLAYRYLKK